MVQLLLPRDFLQFSPTVRHSKLPREAGYKLLLSTCSNVVDDFAEIVLFRIKFPHLGFVPLQRAPFPPPLDLSLAL